MYNLTQLNHKIDLVISKKTIDKINLYYKKNHKKIKNIEEFDKNILEEIDKLKSGKDEIEKQLLLGKGLQPGVLFECVIIQSLAEHFDLDEYIVSDNIEERYIYYSDKKDIKLIQMGSPTGTDLSLVKDGQECLIEIKDTPALLRDKDLLYDDNGKMIIPKDLEECFKNVLLSFNEKHSITDIMGTNYVFAEEDDEYLPLIKRTYEQKNIKYLLTSSNDELFFIDVDSLDKKVNGKHIISLTGSEIRSVGKNSRVKPFAPIYLDKVIKDYGIEEKDEVLYISKTDNEVIGPVKGRGKSIYTRFKINNCFYIQYKNLEENESYYIIKKKDIRQSKSGVSFHISLNKY